MQKSAAGLTEEQFAERENFSAAALNRMAQPEEIANVMVFLLSDDATYISGSTYSVDGGVFC